jgi:orotate phosphoribosyltransferase
MSSSTQEEVLQIFRDSRALLTGHFVLRSGLHSGHFFQCAQVCQYLDKVTRLIELLRPKLAQYPCDVVLAPAMGGLVVGQELARQLGVRFIFVEKENDRLVLRRNFSFQPHERVLIAEDVVTRGGRVLECLEIVKKHGAKPVAVTSLVDRSGGQTKFEVPFLSLLELTFPTYPADQLPPELAKIPATKPGS